MVKPLVRIADYGILETGLRLPRERIILWAGAHGRVIGNVMLAVLQRYADKGKNAFKAAPVSERKCPPLKPVEKHVDYPALREDIISRFSKTLTYLAK